MHERNWQKSSFSGDDSNCVEVRIGAGLVELRESDDGDVILHTDPAAFADLLGIIKAGILDHHA
ncbi:DUF397 domain-containing protein [Kitasatospora purpeofusca]|uniref:DUF397 domain-containing protein n=1 Tax=Kitasatospora purpeofusca TaxID=67352 RepID=UPI00225B24AB|nr:DUF397 domain-containing protein [Kitasatospora purpeofusca]MCX4686390.1 DUF397 domain-containing protein [Kitasatospora purpeofusca]